MEQHLSNVEDDEDTMAGVYVAWSKYLFYSPIAFNC